MLEKNSCQCPIFHEDIVKKVNSSILNDTKVNEIANIFKVLGDFTRVKILESTKDYEMCVCDLANVLNISKSAVSHQLKLLKKYGLVTSRKSGKMVYYKACNLHITKMIKDAYDHIEYYEKNR